MKQYDFPPLSTKGDLRLGDSIVLPDESNKDKFRVIQIAGKVKRKVNIGWLAFWIRTFFLLSLLFAVNFAMSFAFDYHDRPAMIFLLVIAVFLAFMVGVSVGHEELRRNWERMSGSG